jgi:signal peptidase II
VDRLVRGPHLFRGEVVDFIYLSFWPTFNLADSAIVVGVVLLLVMSNRAGREASTG